MCNCLPGFRRADKFNCIEINECLIGAHSCHENANCINTIGSYSCRCKSGYEGDGFQCKRKCPMSECEICFLSFFAFEFSFECDAFSLSFFFFVFFFLIRLCECAAVCKQQCLNGGVCTSPDVCTCRMGYIGASCERDLDECATGLHTCKSSAYCVNMPGWYYCKCKPGYETHNYECHDINECYHGRFAI